MQLEFHTGGPLKASTRQNVDTAAVFSSFVQSPEWKQRVRNKLLILQVQRTPLKTYLPIAKF